MTQTGIELESAALRVFWTAKIKGPDNRINNQFYVTRTGYWRGSPLELVRWFDEQADSLRFPTEVFRLQPERIGVRDWPTESAAAFGQYEMLLEACEKLNDQNPQLMPLPPGRGILYVSGRITALEWLEIRDEVCARRFVGGS